MLDLVILTTHFGTNFSGGSTATVEIFSRIEAHFDRINVIGTELGEHPFRHLNFIETQSWSEARLAVNSLKGANTVFYGDFYNSIIFSRLGLPFYFTYHDNWPELAFFGKTEHFRSLFYTPIYETIFRSAKNVISVSKFKLDYIRKYNRSSTLIRNGFGKTSLKEIERNDFLMVGNIDSRKYELAIELFRQWQNPKVRIHIYGRVNDPSIADRLNQFSFVVIEGFKNKVPYHKYRGLIHTSRMENLPIAFCEAIYSRTPVVAFDVGGVSEIIDKRNGILIEPFDIPKMAKTINSLDETSFGFAESRLASFNWELASKQYLSILKP